jgi:hypothetical protein
MQRNPVALFIVVTLAVFAFGMSIGSAWPESFGVVLVGSTIGSLAVCVVVIFQALHARRHRDQLDARRRRTGGVVLPLDPSRVRRGPPPNGAA